MNRKEIYILAVITFSTVVAWVSFGIYHANKTSKVNKIEIKELSPLTPTFDNDIISQLETREDY